MREMRNWREYLIERLAVDREETVGFLQAVMEDYQVYGNSAAVVSAVQVVVESQGGVAEVAKRAALSPETLSKILSSEEAPRIDMLSMILKALGYRISIESLGAKCPDAEMEEVDAAVAPIKVTASDTVHASDK